MSGAKPSAEQDDPLRSSRPSPPTRRVVQILGLLGAHPDEAWTLASIAQRLELTPSTVLAILNELSDASFVIRGPGKTYTLGPALLTLGRAADARFPAIRTIAAELTPYVSTLGCGGSVAFVDGHDLVTAYRFGPPSLFVRRDVVAIRIPFAFPHGAGFAAWMGDAAQEAWAAPGALTTGQRRRLASALAAIRRRGYEVVGPRVVTDYIVAELEMSIREAEDPSAHMALTQLRAQWAQPAWWRDFFLTKLAPDEHYSVGLITVPVFDANRFPRFSIALHFNGRSLTGREAMDVGEHLQAEGSRLTKLLGGDQPDKR